MALVRSIGNEPPEGLAEGFMTSSDGVALRYALLVPPQAQGTVVVLGGRGDYLERYLESFRDLARMGFAVASFDWRGQGGSGRLQADPYRSNVPDFALYDTDLESFMRKVVLKDCPGPYYLLAHSMGGCVGLRALQRHDWFARAVLTSPMLDVNAGRWPKWLARFVARLLFGLGFGNRFAPGRPARPLGPQDFVGNVLTHDKTRYDRDQRILAQRPQLGIGGATIGWLHAAFKAMDSLKKLAPGTRLKTPVLIVAAGRERVTVTEACREFARRVANVSFLEIGEARHEILMECDGVRAQFFAAFRAFVTAD
jgi:lysophospholipase